MALSVRAASNLFISVVGAGVLGLPYAFKRSGLILGSVVMIVIAALNLHCMLLLVSFPFFLKQCYHLQLLLLLSQHAFASVSLHAHKPFVFRSYNAFLYKYRMPADPEPLPCCVLLLCAVLCTALHWLWLGCFALFNMYTYDIKLCQAAVSCNTLAHLPAAPRTACHTGLHPSLLGHLGMSIHTLTAHLCHIYKALAWLLVKRT